MSVKNDSTADTLYGTGYWLLEADRHEDAKHVFRTMLTLAPRDERAWLALGMCHERAHELDKAARLYALVPFACTTSLRAHIARARVLRKMGREDEAAQAYDHAAELAYECDDGRLAEVIAAEGSLE